MESVNKEEKYRSRSELLNLYELLSMDIPPAKEADCSFKKDLECLLKLSPDHFYILFDMCMYFNKENYKKTIETLKKSGVQFGRKQSIDSPNYEKEAERYLKGEITGVKAAENCGLSYQTFMKRIKSYRKRMEFEEEQKELESEGTVNKNCLTSEQILFVCNRWADRELTKTEAAAMLGVSLKAFNRILKKNSIVQNAEPKEFGEMYRRWCDKEITKKVAAENCHISLSFFDELVRKRRVKEREVCAEILKNS